MATKPIKRIEELIPLSRNHHHSLLLCWKIRTGISKQVELKRIQKYIDWFYPIYIAPHLEVDEQHLFSILGQEHALVITAVEYHKDLRSHFTQSKASPQSHMTLVTTLQECVRFKERILYQEIQSRASSKELSAIVGAISIQEFEENAMDEFWL